MAPWAVAIGTSSWCSAIEGWRALRGRPALPLLALLLVLPVLLVGGLGYIAGVNYHVRFILWILIPIWRSGWVRDWLPGGSRWHVRLATLGLIGLSAISIYHRLAVPRYQNEDLRSAAAYLAYARRSGAAGVHRLGLFVTAAQYYLDEPWRVVTLPIADRSNDVIAGSSDLNDADATLAAAAPSESTHLADL